MAPAQIVKTCLELLFPPVCLGCDQRMVPGKTTTLCERCFAQIRYLVPPFCRVCGVEVSGAERDGHRNPLCGECLRHPPPYVMARSVVRYEAQIQKLVQKLKFDRDLAVVPGLAEIVSRYAMDDFSDIDAVVVVPLHLRRLRWRGLNQAVVLARLFFADRLPLIHTNWLQRARYTVPQTELGGAARRKNLTGAFRARPASEFSGARVCLVDDVFTTGTTVRECSKVILDSGAREVKVLTLARVNAPQCGRYVP